MDPVVKELHTGDIPEVVRLAGMLHLEVEQVWPDCPPFNPELITTQLYGGISAGVMFALGLVVDERTVGTLVFTVFPCFEMGAVIGAEHFMYVEPEHRVSGLALIRAFEKMSAEKGAKFLDIGHFEALQGPKMCRLMSTLGYRLHQLRYLKAV